MSNENIQITALEGAPDWVHLSKTSGTGNDTIAVTCDDNPVPTPRRAEFFAVDASGGIRIPLAVEQAGATVYYSAEVNKRFYKNCPVNFTDRDGVLYNVPAGKYTSLISQADANAQAVAEADANGPAKAEAEGVCVQTTFWNTRQSAWARKNDCPPNTTGTEEENIIPAGRYSSTISQDDADAKALQAARDGAQAHANEVGECLTSTWYNDGNNCATATRDNCAEGCNPPPYTYCPRAGEFSSNISEEDANKKAQDYADAHAQEQANLHGSCGECDPCAGFENVKDWRDDGIVYMSSDSKAGIYSSKQSTCSSGSSCRYAYREYYNREECNTTERYKYERASGSDWTDACEGLYDVFTRDSGRTVYAAVSTYSGKYKTLQAECTASTSCPYAYTRYDNTNSCNTEQLYEYVRDAANDFNECAGQSTEWQDGVSTSGYTTKSMYDTVSAAGSTGYFSTNESEITLTTACGNGTSIYPVTVYKNSNPCYTGSNKIRAVAGAWSQPEEIFKVTGNKCSSSSTDPDAGGTGYYWEIGVENNPCRSDYGTTKFRRNSELDAECKETPPPATIVASLSHRYDCEKGCGPTGSNPTGHTEMVITHIDTGTKYTFNTSSIQTSAFAIYKGKYTIERFDVYCNCNMNMPTLMGNTHIFFNAREVQLNDTLTVMLSANFESQGPDFV